MPRKAKPKFVCDINLPDEGIELDNKILLLSLLDAHGGPTANNRKTRLLQKFSTLHPSKFGVSGSKRHNRAKWPLDRWKRDEQFEETRAAIRKLALEVADFEHSCDQVLSHSSISFAMQEQGNSADYIKPEATTTTSAPATISSPPAVKKKTTTKDNMASKLSSPLRMKSSKGKKKGKQLALIRGCFDRHCSGDMLRFCVRSCRVLQG